MNMSIYGGALPSDLLQHGCILVFQSAKADSLFAGTFVRRSKKIQKSKTIRRVSMTKKKQTKGVLAKYFPLIQAREEIQAQIAGNPKLKDTFLQWDERAREEFLDFCSGERGIKVVYDGIFKEVFNPEITPERLEALLSLVLGFDVKIEKVLPNDGARLGAESSLLYTDIVVQHTDGSLSDVEIQKIGYNFPGERCACYSADHLLRQYKKVRGENNRHFNYREIQSVYTIVFFEHSPEVFKKFPNQYVHRFSQKSDTGLELELVQKYYFVSLDIFKKNMENKSVRNEMEAWLSFLSYDDPKRIIELITAYPRFKAMYQDIYEICINMEEVMSVYSKELAEMDRNTVKYMMDEIQEELNQTKERLEQAETEKRQAEEEKKQAEEEKRQAEEEKRQAEEEKKQARERLEQAETEKRQAEEEKRQAEEKKRQAEEEKKQARERLEQAETEKNQAEDRADRLGEEVARKEAEIQKLKEELLRMKAAE